MFSFKPFVIPSDIYVTVTIIEWIHWKQCLTIFLHFFLITKSNTFAFYNVLDDEDVCVYHVQVKHICILPCSWWRRCLCLPCSWKEVAKNQIMANVFNKTFEFFFHKNVASFLRIFYASCFCLLLTKYGPEWSCTKSPAHLAIKCFKQPRLNSSW